MTSFDTDKKHLTFLLDQIDNRDLALPDFQRDFVWKPGETRELVRSVMQSFPAGTILLMQGGAKHFKPRPFSEAATLAGVEPSFLALDGQQRLTSLSLAFSGRGDYRYFLHIQELLDGEDLDEAIEVYHHSRQRVWRDIKGQARDLALPMSRLRDFANWRDDVIDERELLFPTEDRKDLKRKLNEIEATYIAPVLQYQFPVTTLNRHTSLDAVCTIFETLNRTGVKLSVFDLLVARGYAQGVELRGLLEQARADYPILDEFSIDPYYLLQVVAVWVRGNPTRSTVLGLDVKNDVEPRWEEAASNISAVLHMLQSECGVLTKKYFPYRTMLLTLAAAWSEVTAVTGPEVAARRDKLKRWFWCATFAQRYETQGNSRTSNDVPELRAWLTGAGNAPEVVNDGELRTFRAVNNNTQALYSAAIALSLRNHPLDFHQGKPLTATRIVTDQIDDHHVFPQAYLGSAYPKALKDSVLNRTLIDRATNIRIQHKAPSAYLGDMEKVLGAQLMAQVLESHGLPADAQGSLLSDDFEAFLTWRERHLLEEIRVVTGWPMSAAAATA